MPENFGSVLPQLLCGCGSLFFAVVAAVFMVLLLRSARQRQQLQATLNRLPLRSVADLRPGPGLVRLKGVIAQVPESVPPLLEIAVVRVAIQAGRRREDRQSMDRVQARPFLLDDGTGTVWVDPTGLDRFLLGEGIVPEDADRAAALQAVGLPPTLVGPVQVWALRAGQEVTVVGTVQQRDGQVVVAKAKGQPLVISPGDIPDIAVQAQRQSIRAWVGIGILGLIALCMLAISGITLIGALITLWSGG
ncbi:MAG: E3 ubiquitin ligase family protein [Anaerolineae bacterium]|nr:E3 ubiquitin ligase family protein [Anaerolineae bacterium]